MLSETDILKKYMKHKNIPVSKMEFDSFLNEFGINAVEVIAEASKSKKLYYKQIEDKIIYCQIKNDNLIILIASINIDDFNKFKRKYK